MIFIASANHVCQRFNQGSPEMHCGVDQICRIDHHSHMAGKENKIARLQGLVVRENNTQRFHLHVAIARRGDPDGR